MPKKTHSIIASIALLLGVLPSFLGANNLNKDIEQTILNKTHTEAKVIELKPLDIKKLNIAIIEINNNQLPLFVSDDGKTILGVPDIFLTGNDKILETIRDSVSQTQRFNSRGKQDKLLGMFKSNSDSVVFLNSAGSKTKKTTFIVTDPNCPYCKDEMQRIDSILPNSNVALILVGIIGGQNSEIKSADILEATHNILKSKQSQKKKEEAILNHIKEVYFNKNYEPSVKVQSNIEIAKKNSQLVIQAGVNAVPYKFITDK